jgi:signal transduction histidine kinase
MKVRGPRADRPRDYRQAIHEFSRSLTLVVDEDQLRAAIPAKLREFFGLERVAIFLREGDGAPFRVASARGIEAPVADAAAFPADGRLARWLKVNEMPLVLAEQPGVVDFLDAGERDTLRSLGAAACFPLVALNQLRGFLAVGPTGRGPALGLDPGERELLGVLAGQAALAFENAALIREQRDRLKRLYRAERLATAGEMAAGAAHEIRNPLTSIRSAIQHLRGDYEDASPRAELIDDILAEVDRINEIVEALLSFARPAQVKFESVDLAELVRQEVRERRSGRAGPSGRRAHRCARSQMWCDGRGRRPGVTAVHGRRQSHQAGCAERRDERAAGDAGRWNAVDRGRASGCRGGDPSRGHRLRYHARGP